MQPVKESLYASALAEIKEGAPIRAVARKYGLARSTLQDRLRGALPKSKGHVEDQRLSPEQESLLADWILHEEDYGRAPGFAKAARMAQSILSEGGPSQPIGKNWVYRYLKRNPHVRIKPSDHLERARARGSTREAYNAFFDRLERYVKEKNILPKNLSNIDEHGLREGESRAGKVLGTSLTPRSYVTSSDATAWVTVIECGTAEGVRLPPCVILQGEDLQGQWYGANWDIKKEFPGWEFDTSPSGWSNARIALKWLKEIYIPRTTPENPTEWRLLVLDEHSSHTTAAFLKAAYDSKVLLLFLPPHTSHKTQPLDRSVFAAVKAYFREAARDLADFTASAPINKQRFFLTYRDASARGVSPRNLISGFRETGIWPVNRAKILEDPEAVIEPETRPKTPPPAAQATESGVWTTPRRAQDTQAMEEAVLAACGQDSVAARSVRTAFKKLRKTVAKSHAENARLRYQLSRQDVELEAARPRKRAKVHGSTNDRFPPIENIEQARDESLRVGKRYKRAPQDENPRIEPEIIVATLRNIAAQIEE
jgi:hypothetical protein